MSGFQIHSLDTAPEDAKAVLAKTKAKYGFVPNLIGGLAEAPAAAEAYLAVGEAFASSSFTPTERHVVWFTINAIHGCDYCMAAHTGIAKSESIAEDVIETARAGGDYSDPRLQALKELTTKMVLDRGWVKPEEIEAFLAAGFTRRNVLEVILGISHKVLSNYTNHVVGTPVDRPFAPFEWVPPAAAAE